MKWKASLYAFVAMLLMGMISLFCISEPYVRGVLQKEREMNYQFLGANVAKALENRAEYWYQQMFVKTHMVQATMSTTGPADVNLGSSDPIAKKTESAARTALTWWDNRIKVIWSAAFNTMLRLSMLSLWLPLALLGLVPVIVDSIVVRKIKSTSFAMTSPHLHLLGVQSIFWMLFTYVILMFLPITLHPMMAPTLIGVSCACLWLGISQFAKRA